MDPTFVLSRLRQAYPDLKERFGIAHLGIFGSVARGEAGPTSDVDLLVDFAGPATLDAYMGLKYELESLLGVPVDLATRRSLKPSLRAIVERDLKHVA